MILGAKFHVESSPLSVLKIAILMLSCEFPSTPLKISLHENETMVNLKNASFIVIMLLHLCLTHRHSQIKPRSLFGESFTLKLSHTGITSMLHVVKDRTHKTIKESVKKSSWILRSLPNK